MFVLRGVEPLILENNIFVFDLIAKTLLYMIEKLKIIVSQS